VVGERGRHIFCEEASCQVLVLLNKGCCCCQEEPVKEFEGVGEFEDFGKKTKAFVRKLSWAAS